MRAVNVALSLLVSAVLALGVAELGLRLLGKGPKDNGLEFDAKLGWSKRPNAEVRRTGPEFDVVIATDAQGLRDDYGEDVTKPDGVRRVVCLGDSFTLGFTVAREDLFVDRLEASWRAAGEAVEVVNAGTQAYSTDQEVAWLLEHGARWEPDLVLLFAYENDLYWNTRETYAGSPKPLFDDSGELVSGTLEDPGGRSWLERTALHETFVGPPRTERFAVPGTDAEILAEQTVLLVDAPPVVAEAEARTAAIVRRARRWCDEHGARLAVCPIPSHSQVDPAYGDEVMDAMLGLPGSAWNPHRPYQAFLDAANGAGALVLDPLDALRAAQEAGEEQYHRIDWHLSPAGNRTLAAYLLDALAERGVAPEGVALAAVAHVGAESEAGLPGWLPWFVGLWAVLGTLYAVTYRDEPALAGAGKVGALLAVVFGLVIGGTWLIGLLPPRAAQVAVALVILAILGFVGWKLGDRLGTIAELLKAFTLRGHWYLLPVLTVLLTVGSLLVVAASSPLVAPFIYTLF